MQPKAWIAALSLGLLASCQGSEAAPAAPKGTKVSQNTTIEKINKSEEEWKKVLTPEQFYVMRKKGTERAWTGKLVHNHEKGVYVCAACGLPLFSSETKFESGTGWPSFYQPIEAAHVGEETDRSLFMMRTEVHCARCGAHLGHVFDDGPRPTGLRYCINSVSLDFKKAE